MDIQAEQSKYQLQLEMLVWKLFIKVLDLHQNK